MARHIKVRAIRRREVEEDKLALAFLMLAKVLHEQDAASGLEPADEAIDGSEAA